MPFPAHWDSSAATKLSPKCFNFAWVLSWGLGYITKSWRPRSLERACKSSEPEIKRTEISSVMSQLQLYVKDEPWQDFMWPLLPSQHYFRFFFLNFALQFIFLTSKFSIQDLWTCRDSSNIVGAQAPSALVERIHKGLARRSPMW